MPLEGGMATGNEQVVIRNPDGTFPKGSTGNPKGRNQGSVAAVPPMLADLRWAYRNADKKAPKRQTPQRERFRQMFKDRPEEFLKLLRDMEREHKITKKEPSKKAEAEKPAAQAEEDVGADRALALARRWLEERRQGAQPPPE